MSQLILFISLTIIWLIKIALNNYWMFHRIIVSSLWKKPTAFFSFWLPKIGVSVLFAFLCMISHNIIVILIVLISDVWMQANIMYKRANNRVIDYYAMKLTGNMNGFWGSVVIFLRTRDFLIFFLSAGIVFLCLFCNYAKIPYWIFFVVCLNVLFLQGIANFCHSKVENVPFVPIQITQKQRFKSWCHNVMPVDENSVIHSVLWIISDSLTITNNHYDMSYEDEQRVIPFIQQKHEITQNTPLLILLIESMENWVIQPDIMPNLFSLLKSNNTLYCQRIKSQIRQGISADGQLIINTGLLPIQNGATSYLFPSNIYPSLINISSNNVVILPRDDNAWNKDTMLSSYGLTNRIIAGIEDKLLFEQSIKSIQEGFQSVWTLTVATHAPFTCSSAESDLNLPTNMPTLMQNYIKSFNVLDKGLSVIIDAIKSSEILQNTTIVITGDHTIIPEDDRKDFINYCKQANLEYGVEEFCPLIIRSPKIEGNKVVSDMVYQMDIYPTILHLIGCDDYFWKGFGVNLLDSTARNNRPISEQDAYILSDKIIRSDYFRTLQK